MKWFGAIGAVLVALTLATGAQARGLVIGPAQRYAKASVMTDDWTLEQRNWNQFLRVLDGLGSD